MRIALLAMISKSQDRSGGSSTEIKEDPICICPVCEIVQGLLRFVGRQAEGAAIGFGLISVKGKLL
jgi:hypothetical protein